MLLLWSKSCKLECLDSGRSAIRQAPEGWSELAASKLGYLGIYIADLSKCQNPGGGDLEGEGCSLLYSG